MGHKREDMQNVKFEQGELPDTDWDKLYHIMGGAIFFQTLSAAVQFDLFGLLKKHGNLTSAEIAGHLEIEEQPARILLLGCTTLELLHRSGATYSNSEMAERFLLRDQPGSLVPIIEWQHFINYRAMYWFHDSIKLNRNRGLNAFEGDEDTLYERLAHDPKLEKIFQDAMQAISVHANEMLARHVDFSDVRHLVDVGGGNGTNIMELAAKYPSLRATVFDSPSVCEIAKNNIDRAGLSERLGAIAGNCFNDALPSGVDCFLFCHFFTIWSVEENRQLLQKAFEALPAGGRVVVFNMMQSDTEDGPLTAAWGSPYFLTLATGKGMLYCWKEYEAWMKEAGFATVERLQLPRDHGVVTGIKT